jgi:hypothetical protein
VDAAVAAVRADLADPAREPMLAAASGERAAWVAAWPDGADYVLCLLAQDVQEAVHAQADPYWPLCPEHRDHALFVEPDLGTDPFWVCHRSGLPVCQVGQLGTQP